MLGVIVLLWKQEGSEAYVCEAICDKTSVVWPKFKISFDKYSLTYCRDRN